MPKLRQDEAAEIQVRIGELDDRLVELRDGYFSGRISHEDFFAQRQDTNLELTSLYDRLRKAGSTVILP